jgi:hypothetical protein
MQAGYAGCRNSSVILHQPNGLTGAAHFEFGVYFVRERAASFSKFLQKLDRHRRRVLADGGEDGPPDSAIQLFVTK